MKPREPDYEELKSLQDYVWKHDLTRHPKSVIKWAGLYPAVIFDNYEGEKGTYKGKIMVIIWPERPEYHEVFTFDQYGELHAVEKDPDMHDPRKRLVLLNHHVRNLSELNELMADPKPLL